MRFIGLSLLCQLCVVSVRERKLSIGRRILLTVDNNQIILFPCGYEFYIENYPEAGLYLAEMLYLPIDLIESFQKLYTVTDQIRNKTSFFLPQNPELIYCWEQLKTSVSRGFSTKIQEHLAMGVLLSLGVNHVNHLLLSYSKQSLISRCYNLLLSEPGTKWTANKVARYLYISVSTLHRRLASEGVSFQSILDDVRLNNALSAIQTTVKPISEIAREMVISVLLVLLKDFIIVLI